MCVAVPGRVIEAGEGRAIVDVGGANREVSTIALPGLSPGDHVLVSFGMAVERLTETEARDLEGLWEEIALAQESAMEAERSAAEVRDEA